MTAQAAAPHVAVVGGGLAGITAAIALAETGTRVTLLESKPRLGGATCSFSRGELTVDNGQHVFLRCCSAYRGLLARLGMTGSVTLQDRFDVTVLRPGGRARLRRTVLPGPLHMGQALASYQHLSFAERLRVVHARRGEAQAHLLIRTNGTTDPVPPGWETHPVSLEELTLAYLREPGAASLPGPSGARHVEPTEVAR